MEIEQLVGKILSRIERHENEIIFSTSENEQYRMFHDQDCCESVYIESIDGDIKDLIGNPILEAEERTQTESVEDGDLMYTFYTIRNVKSSVTIRWNGSSNGYYSISVDFEKIADGE